MSIDVAHVMSIDVAPPRQRLFPPFFYVHNGVGSAVYKAASLKANQRPRVFTSNFSAGR